jgi:hypothetical protein
VVAIRLERLHHLCPEVAVAQLERDDRQLHRSHVGHDVDHELARVEAVVAHDRAGLVVATALGQGPRLGTAPDRAARVLRRELRRAVDQPVHRAAEPRVPEGGRRPPLEAVGLAQLLGPAQHLVVGGLTPGDVAVEQVGAVRVGGGEPADQR